eukprot:357572-Pelagomonas_calceolata.AAC.1
MRATKNLQSIKEKGFKNRTTPPPVRLREACTWQAEKELLEDRTSKERVHKKKLRDWRSRP